MLELREVEYFKCHIGFTAIDNSTPHAQSLHFDWPNAVRSHQSKIVEKMSKSCQNLIKKSFEGWPGFGVLDFKL